MYRILTIAFLFAATPTLAEPPCETKEPCPSTWTRLDATQRARVSTLAEDYKSFMAIARTQFTTVNEVRRRASLAGFREWRPGEPITVGSRWFVNNRDQSLALIVIGEQSMSQGARIAAAHIDSPHLELKARPLYESEGFALFHTYIHGSILNYQWGNIPLALMGRVSRKDGSSVDLSVGLAPGDPVFMIAGLSPHVDVDLRERKNRDVLQAEELSPIVGSVPASVDADVRTQVTAYLRGAYALSMDDLVSASLTLVPATAPRDVGFDRSMMTMYGQDDRLGVYAATQAIIALEHPAETAMLLLANNEEVGSNNNTGAGSDFFSDLVSELIYAQMGEKYREPYLKRALRASRVLSIDVNDAINPTWPTAWESENAPRLGHGVNIKIYGKGNNATPEYTAWIRRVLDDADVPWQTATYKSGAGGGTLGGELSRRDMNVIDIGVPVLSIHNTHDLSSKIDVWWLCRGVDAFYAAR